eukprot:SAG11_NODE_2555_length_3224_cov_2.896640_4_plen_90_part_00
MGGRVPTTNERVPVLLDPGVMKAVELRNVIDGVSAEIRFPLLSPLITDIEVLDRKKKHTRAKLYYLRDRCESRRFFNFLGASLIFPMVV